MEPPLGLASSEIHLWMIRPRDVSVADVVQHSGWLTGEELARGNQFAFEHLRHDYRVTRSLVRFVLSLYADVPPAAWRFETNRYGRPHLVDPRARPFFNLAHTKGLIVCAIADRYGVGVDVENTSADVDLDIADRYFSPSEVAQLAVAPAAQRHRLFFRFWTLKESYIKARGMGLSLPLDQFSFDLRQGHPITISFGPAIDDDPRRWQFGLYELGDHMVAWAIDREKTDPVVPLGAMLSALDRGQLPTLTPAIETLAGAG